MEAKHAAMIRNRLRDHGIQQQQVAARADISKMYLTDILYGRRSGQRVQGRINQAIDELIVADATPASGAVVAAPAKFRPAHYRPSHSHSHSHSRSGDEE